MNYNFNWSAISGGAPYITLSSLGIAFNSVSIERLSNPKKILIGFDEAQCTIGVKAYEGETGIKPYDFADRVKNGWIRIGCRDFIKYLQAISGADFTKAKRYIANFNAEMRILLVSVKSDSESGDGDE